MFKNVNNFEVKLLPTELTQIVNLKVQNIIGGFLKIYHNCLDNIKTILLSHEKKCLKKRGFYFKILFVCMFFYFKLQF